MDMNTVSTRRRFLTRAGAALSAPLTVAGLHAASGEELDGGALGERPADLEDVHAIRALNREYARRINRGEYGAAAALFAEPSQATVDESVHRLSADAFGEDDAIELAPDRRSAVGRFQCTVHTRIEIGPACTLVDMARAQGEGFVERSETAVIEAEYVKEAGAWKIIRAARRAV